MQPDQPQPNPQAPPEPEESAEATPTAPPVEAPAPGPTVPEPVAAPEKPRKPSILRRFFGWLFGTETRFGRFNRRALLWFGGFVGVFTLGLLATYLLLYQPALADAQRVRAEAGSALQERDAALAARDQARKDLSAAQTQVAELQKQVSGLEAQVDLLGALQDVTAARMSLAAKDRTGARKALETTGARLDALAAYLKDKDPAAGENLQSRLKLVLNELTPNPETAASDLKILSDQLEKLAATDID